jgi:aerobic-type carbon monoxide dehydrogenase small subunit (CoxS/CutS family)
MPFKLTVNGKVATVDADGDTPLLWILRDQLGLTGTKYGCGVGVCGACTVLEGPAPVRACQVTIADAAGKKYTTIEGLGNDRCPRAWLEEDVAQCGYCQPGMIVEAVALLRSKPNPTDAQIDDAMAGHVCRCGTYPRLRKAIHLAAKR